MNYPEFHDLVFDEESKRAIERIRRIPRLATAFARALAGGVFVTIFVGSGPLGAAFNILTTDWKALAEAMLAVPAIARNRMAWEASEQWIRTQSEGNTELSRFWKTIHEQLQNT